VTVPLDADIDGEAAALVLSLALALCRRRFTEADGCGAPLPVTAAERVILDFEVDDVDATYARLASIGVTWVMAPTDQPWGGRSAMFRDPDGNLVNLFTRHS